MELKGKPLQLIATSDIGHFAADAFLNPEKYKDKAISLAGDELTYDERARIFQQKTRNPVPTTFGPLCSLFLVLVKDMGHMYKWFHDCGYKVDIQRFRETYPELRDFGSWIVSL